MVVIDIGAPPTLSPWLEETTYLIDNLGHTTAMVAQTDQPTAGVALQPVPFTAANEQALLKTSATQQTAGLPTATTIPHITPAPTLAPTSSPARHSPSAIVFAGAGVGAAVGLVIMAVVIYLLRRRSKRNHLRTNESLEDDYAWEDEKAGSRHSFDSWDTLGMAQSARLAEKHERQHHGLRSTEEVEKEYKEFNSMNDRDRDALRHENGDIWIRRRDHDAESGSSTTIAASPPTSLHTQTSREARDFRNKDTIPGRAAQPASILKQAAQGRLGEASQRDFARGHAQSERPNLIETTAERAKRGVRWVEEKQTIIVDRWIGRRSVASWFSDGNDSEA